MRISAIAKKTKTPVETIRYYERIGLIPRTEREPSGYRNYSLKATNLTGGNTSFL